MEEMKQQSVELCGQIKSQMNELGINRFILSDALELGLGDGNVHFEGEAFNDYLGDIIPEIRLYYIAGNRGYDSFAIVYGISVEAGELIFHVIEGTEGDGGTQYSDSTNIYNLDQLFSEMRDYQEFDTVSMLTFYLKLLQGNLLYEEVKFTVD